MKQHELFTEHERKAQIPSQGHTGVMHQCARFPIGLQRRWHDQDDLDDGQVARVARGPERNAERQARGGSGVVQQLVTLGRSAVCYFHHLSDRRPCHLHHSSHPSNHPFLVHFDPDSKQIKNP